MIYYDRDLSPVIESIYLGEPLSGNLGKCNILVNPEHLEYMFGKTVIINDPDYSWSDAITLTRQGCRVISRLRTEIQGIDFQPYILRVNMSLRWNGEFLDFSSSRVHMSDVLGSLCGDDQKFKYDIDKRELYFPKILCGQGVQDYFGNLTALGWALQQVGCNIINSSKFVDLDLKKTKKVW